jgi:hypothetical protein
MPQLQQLLRSSSAKHTERELVDVETLSCINEQLPIHLKMIAEMQTQKRFNVPITAASEF